MPMQKALDGSFSDCEFRWEDGHCVKAHLAYLSRNQTFREAAAPKVVPVPSEVWVLANYCRGQMITNTILEAPQTLF